MGQAEMRYGRYLRKRVYTVQKTSSCGGEDGWEVEELRMGCNVNAENMHHHRGLGRLLSLAAGAEGWACALCLALFCVRLHRALRSKVASVTVLAKVTQQGVRVLDMLAHVVVLAAA
jgi:hypothetical protein